jgi:acrylyl-CoA reductase (NADPH)
VNFLACRVHQGEGGVRAGLESLTRAALSSGDVLVRAHWSGINFKDALAVTGRGKILRRSPLNAGIDVSGLVESSQDPRYKPGDAVVMNGMGLGESHDGGFAEYVQVPGDWIVPLPAGLDLREAMILGTAGFTTALSLHRLELNGQEPQLGPMVVTGASGGVGSVAVSMFAARGYDVIAVSGRPEQHDYLKRLGAQRVHTPPELELGTRPLESARYGGAIDNVGGELLAGLVRHIAVRGSVACVGNAGGPELSMTVLPLILRGVSLLGISSATCSMDLRRSLWTRLGADLKPAGLEHMVSDVVPLGGVLAAAQRLMERHSHGRILVDLRQY